MNKPFAQSAKAALLAYKSRESGLSSEEIKKRQEIHGRNELPKDPPASWVKIFFRQFLSPLMIVLFGAAFVSMLLHEYVDLGVIILAIIVNVAIGFIQELKATRALEALRSYIQQKAIVRRSGEEVEVHVSEIVPGDILILRSGDKIGADGRIIKLNDFQTNEAALTGESAPVKKMVKMIGEKARLAERSNMVFSGTSVLSGYAEILVIATGLKTEIGKIASLVRETKEERTPLQIQLSRLATWISIIVFVLVLLIFLIGLWLGESFEEMAELSVSLAVAAVPEGLVIAVTIILAIGMQRILKRKALVRKLIAAETLGSVSVICTDKTGTITKGEMQVSEIVTPSGAVKVTPRLSQASKTIQMLEFAMLASEVSVSEGGDLDTIEIKGNPTEVALVKAGMQAGTSYNALLTRHPRIDRIPFDSSKKYSASLIDWKKSNTLLVLGAPERVLAKSTHIYQNGSAKKKLEELRMLVDSLAEKGLRVLAIAAKDISDLTIKKTALADLGFVGFIGLRDPLRGGVKKEISATKKAGIRPMLITGDHPNTAKAIAREAGIVGKAAQVITPEKLDLWSDDELSKHVTDYSVYARVEPRHKIRLVQALKKHNEVVAMVGDGVNDAPAIKAADIGIAVGFGTEVTKEISDMVILDNNIRTITSAVEEGRVIFDNIRKTTAYLLSGSFSEIILISLALAFALPLPLTPIQILWINLVADTFPNIGLAMEPGEGDVMKMKPRPKHERVVNREVLTMVASLVLIVAPVFFAAFYWLLRSGESVQTAQTIMFGAVGIGSVLFVFALRSFRKTIFQSNPLSNGVLLGGVSVGLIMMIMALTMPFFQGLFELAPLSLSNWGILLILGLIPLIGIEIVKELFIFLKRRK